MSRRVSSMKDTTLAITSSACLASLLTTAKPRVAACQRSRLSTSAMDTSNVWRTRLISDRSTWRLSLRVWLSGICKVILPVPTTITCSLSTRICHLSRVALEYTIKQGIGCPPKAEQAPEKGRASVAKRRVKLTFPRNLIPQPIIYYIGKDFDVITNVRRADVAEAEGWVVLELEGTLENIERAIQWVVSKGVRVDSVEGDVIAG